MAAALSSTKLITSGAPFDSLRAVPASSRDLSAEQRNELLLAPSHLQGPGGMIAV